MTDPSSSIESLRSHLLHEISGSRRPMDYVVGAIAEDDRLLRALLRSNLPTAAMITTAARFLFPDLDVITREAIKSGEGTPARRVRDAVLPLFRRRAADFEIVLEGRSLQAQDAGRAEYAKRALQRLDPRLGTAPYLLLEVGASGGGLLSELQKVDPQSIFVGLDTHPLRPDTMVHLQWLLSHPNMVLSSSGQRMLKTVRSARQDRPIVVEGSGRSGVEEVIRRLRDEGVIDDQMPIVLLESCVRPFLTEEQKRELDEFTSAVDSSPRMHIVVDRPGYLGDVAREFLGENDVPLAAAVRCADGDPQLVAVGDTTGSRIVDIGEGETSYVEANQRYLASRRAAGDISQITAPFTDARSVRQALTEMTPRQREDPLAVALLPSVVRSTFKHEALRLESIDPVVAQLLRHVADHPRLLHPLEHDERNDTPRRWMVAARHVAPEIRTLLSDVSPADLSQVVDQVVELLYQRQDELTVALARPPQPDFQRVAYLERALSHLEGHVERRPFLVIQADADCGLALAAISESHPDAVLIGTDQQPRSVDDPDVVAWLSAHTETGEQQERLEQLIETTKTMRPEVVRARGMQEIEVLIERLRSEGVIDSETPLVLVEMSSRERSGASGLDEFATVRDSALRAHIRIDRGSEISEARDDPLVEEAGKYWLDVTVASIQVGDEQRRLVAVGDGATDIVRDVRIIDAQTSDSRSSTRAVRRPPARRALHLDTHVNDEKREAHGVDQEGVTPLLARRELPDSQVTQSDAAGETFVGASDRQEIGDTREATVEDSGMSAEL